MRASARDWPALPYAAWKDTCTTLHLWTQVVGKLRRGRMAARRIDFEAPQDRLLQPGREVGPPAARRWLRQFAPSGMDKKDHCGT